jgi:hypothetical protein
MEDTKDQIAGTPPKQNSYILIVYKIFYKQTGTGKSILKTSLTNSNQIPAIIPNDPSDITCKNNKRTTLRNNKVTSCNVIKRAASLNNKEAFCNQFTGTNSYDTIETSYNKINQNTSLHNKRSSSYIITKRTSYNIKGHNNNQTTLSISFNKASISCPQHTIYYIPGIPERFSANNTPSGNYIPINPM